MHSAYHDTFEKPRVWQTFNEHHIDKAPLVPGSKFSVKETAIFAFTLVLRKQYKFDDFSVTIFQLWIQQSDMRNQLRRAAEIACHEATNVCTSRENFRFEQS